MNNYQERRIKETIESIVKDTLIGLLEDWTTPDFMERVMDNTEDVSDLEYSVNETGKMLNPYVLEKYVKEVTECIYSKFNVQDV